MTSAICPPSVKEHEIEIVCSDQMTLVIDGLLGHHLHGIVVDLATGLRRGEPVGPQALRCRLGCGHQDR